jgi:hypothetical protein
MSDVIAKWNGPVGYMSGRSGWKSEIWTYPSSDLPTADSSSTEIGPFNRAYANNCLNRMAMLFSPEEIGDSLGEKSALLSQIGFFCVGVPGTLRNYEIWAANTQIETLEGGWINTEKMIWSGSITPGRSKWFFFGPFSELSDKSFTWDGQSYLYLELRWKSKYRLQNRGTHKKIISPTSDTQKIIFCKGVDPNSTCQSTGWEFGLTRPITALKWKI